MMQDLLKASLGRSTIVLALMAISGLHQVPGQEPAASVRGPATVEVQVPAWNDLEYIGWLEKNSMLNQAREVSRTVSGLGAQWKHPYALPRPRDAVKSASVWVLGYPGGVITRPGESVIATWSNRDLWRAFREVGIDLLHTGPVKRSGGIRGREYTETIDGWFDRISLDIDPALGTEREYRELVRVASEHGGAIAGDLVPLHTGKGADFQLALRAFGEYPGMYTMVEIPGELWELLPVVDDPWGSVPVPRNTVEELTSRGYLPGLIDSADAVPHARELSGWDATGPIAGVDGKIRRWVYLHYFKPGQPTINWLDPSQAGPRAIAGDLVKTVKSLGARFVRLDAVPFLGIERRSGTARSWSYQHPLSVLGTNQLAFLTRKLGGFSFQELNVPLKELRQFTENGPDLSYDFFTRTQCVHSLLTGDAAPLRLAFRHLLEAGIQPVTLVHDLQNHDEFTYQLVELDFRGDETLDLGGRKVLGRVLREQILREMRVKAAGPAAPHNLLYRAQEDGLATTMAGFIAACLGIRDPYHTTPEQREEIKRAHLLLSHANAMQPGVFSLSCWDLVGALPLARALVAERMSDGDYRWVNRGGVDLMGLAPQADRSAFGLPRAPSLYGSLPAQLADPDSFVSRLRQMLTARSKYQIALSELLDMPDVENASACLLVLRPPGLPRLVVTALNFGRLPVRETLDLSTIPGLKLEGLSGLPAINAVSGASENQVSDSGNLTVRLGPLEGKTIVIEK